MTYIDRRSSCRGDIRVDHALHTLGSTAAPKRAFYPFVLGNTEFLVIDDGRVLSGDPRITHAPLNPGEVENLLVSSFLPADRLVLEANVLLLRRNERIVMFDSGMGDVADRPAWARQAGRLLRNLHMTGVSPAAVTDIIITHGHSDHSGGIMAEDGTSHFPNAQLHMNRIEYDHWTSPELAGGRWNFDHVQAMRNLHANRHRMTFINADQEFLPGIQAVKAPGHTVAHMVFFISTGSGQLCHLADLARHHILNVERPDWPFAGDADGAMTIKSRRDVLDMVSRQRTMIFSSHFPWPGLGHISRVGDGFRYFPSSLDPDDMQEPARP